MARYPGASWRPLPESSTQPKITPRIVIFHSAVSPGWPPSLYDFFNSPGEVLESHMYVQRAGGVEQYIDTNVRADANLDANAFAISVETADDGNPDATPWTPEQLNAMENIARWANATHGIPLVQTSTWDGHGLGYHTMFGAPGHWTPYVKTCPGHARIAQWPAFLARFKAAPPPDPTPAPKPFTEDDMDYPTAIRTLYQVHLDREPDRDGFHAWCQDFANKVAAGATPAAVMAGIEGFFAGVARP